MLRKLAITVTVAVLAATGGVLYGTSGTPPSGPAAPDLLAGVLSGNAPGLEPATATSQPVDLFLRIDGIEGESTDHAHEGEIELLDWGWGVTAEIDDRQRSRGPTGDSDAQFLRLTKAVDTASPSLMFASAAGQQFGSATLTVRAPGGDEPVAILVLELENVAVSAYDVGGSLSNRGTDEVALFFHRIRMTYTPLDNDGSPLPEVTAGWDFRTNEAF